MCDLRDRTALVTGGTGGIGQGIVFGLARAGSRVVVATTRDARHASTTIEELARQGCQAIAVHLDVTDRASVRRCVEEAVERFGHIDVLVNNAGIMQPRLGLELQDEDFNRCLDVNLTGIWRMVQAVIPHLKARGGGRIINTASGAARRGFDIVPGYSASKAGVINLTQSLATALGPHKITVNAICPGEIPTAMQDYTISLIYGTQFEERLHPVQPQKLPLAGPLTVEDIGHAVVFLASDYAKNITGQALNVDRGESMN